MYLNLQYYFSIYLDIWPYLLQSSSKFPFLNEILYSPKAESVLVEQLQRNVIRKPRAQTANMNRQCFLGDYYGRSFCTGLCAPYLQIVLVLLTATVKACIHEYHEAPKLLSYVRAHVHKTLGRLFLMEYLINVLHIKAPTIRSNCDSSLLLFLHRNLKIALGQTRMGRFERIFFGFWERLISGIFLASPHSS